MTENKKRAATRMVPAPSHGIIPERDLNERPVLEARNLGIDFGGLHAVEDFNLIIGKTEIAGLIGPNGAGKTTVFNLLTKVYQPTMGTIMLNGRDTAGMNTAQANKLGIARTFQNIRLFDNMSVEDNVRIGLHNQVRYGMLSGIFRMPGYWRGEREMHERALDLLSIFDMQDLANHQAGSLPYGAQRRLEIVRALATNPSLLLLDEPLGALDLQLRRQMQLELKRLQKKLGITFVYITHDQEEAINMSDRIAVMRGGRFEQLGTPEEIYDEPKTHYVAQFIGRSTTLSGRVEAVGRDTAVIRGACGSFTADASRARLSAGEDCEICVRTERMRVSPVPVEGFQLPVTVREARYAGGSVLTYAILPDGEEAVATSEGRLSDALTPGSTAYLYWNPAQAAVIGGTSHGA